MRPDTAEREDIPERCIRNRLGGVNKSVHVMFHFLSRDLVATQCQAKATVGPSQPSSSLDELVAN